MLSNAELLKRLEEAGVKKVEIASALGLNPSRVTEMYADRGRPLKLDEAKLLVEKFKIDVDGGALTLPVARLLVLHVARQVGVTLDPQSRQVADLGQDLVAFSKFALDPLRRGSVDAVGEFFRALQILRQSQDQEDDSPESNPGDTGGTNGRS